MKQILYVGKGKDIAGNERLFLRTNSKFSNKSTIFWENCNSNLKDPPYFRNIENVKSKLELYLKKDAQIETVEFNTKKYVKLHERRYFRSTEITDNDMLIVQIAISQFYGLEH